MTDLTARIDELNNKLEELGFSGLKSKLASYAALENENRGVSVTDRVPGDMNNSPVAVLTECCDESATAARKEYYYI